MTSALPWWRSIYDPAGNRTLQLDAGGAVTTNTFSNANRMHTSNAGGLVTTYTHDAAGNRIRLEDPLAGNIYYGWDPAGNMSYAEPAAGIVTFTYNAERKRVAKSSHDGSHTLFQFDFNRLLQETDGNGTEEVTYTHITDNPYGNLLSEYDPARGDLVHQYDPQACTNALLDESGHVTGPFKYRAFGQPATISMSGWADLTVDELGGMTVDDSGTLPVNPASALGGFGQKGYYLDAETQLYVLGMGAGGRSYDPVVGRFVSEDRIGFAAGDANLYRYCRNDPINNVDPSGQAPQVDLSQVTTSTSMINSSDEVDLSGYPSGFGAEESGGSGIGRWLFGPPGTDDQDQHARDIVQGAANVVHGLGIVVKGVFDMTLGNHYDTPLRPTELKEEARRDAVFEEKLSKSLHVEGAQDDPQTRSESVGWAVAGWTLIGLGSTVSKLQKPILTPITLNQTSIAPGIVSDAAATPRLTDPAVPLGQQVQGVPDTAMFHLSSAPPAALEAGVNPGATGSSWVQWGDVTHLTRTQFRAGVVGSLAAGGEDNATVAAFKLMNEQTQPLFVKNPTPNFARVQEWRANIPVVPDAVIDLNDNPTGLSASLNAPSILPAGSLNRPGR